MGMTEVVEELDTARGARRVRSRHAALGDDAMVTRAEEHWFEMLNGREYEREE